MLRKSNQKKSQDRSQQIKNISYQTEVNFIFIFNCNGSWTLKIHCTTHHILYYITLMEVCAAIWKWCIINGRTL